MTFTWSLAVSTPTTEPGGCLLGILIIVIIVIIVIIITIVIMISRATWNCPEYGMAFSGNDLAFFEEIPSWEECGEYFLHFCTFSCICLH